MDAGRGGSGATPAATAAPGSPAPSTKKGRSFGARLKRFGWFLLALPVVLLVLTEVMHQFGRGHLFVPFTYHWDLETREVDVRGNKLREVRPRLTNYTLFPIRLESIEGEGILWFKEARFRHRVETRGGALLPWRVVHRTDLVYERQGRPPRTRAIGPWSTVALAWHPVQDAGAGGPSILRRGDEARFVLYSQLDGEERAPGQRVLASPPFRL